MKRPPQFYHPENALKTKVGEGGLPSNILEKGQAFMDSNPVDFAPYAADFLEKLNTIDLSRHTCDKDKTAIVMNDLVNIIMQLKSNGSMFHFNLITMTSDVILRFLEKVDAIDADFEEIMDVYKKVLNVIISKKLTGDGGREGYMLTQELHYACIRYERKHGIIR